MIKTSLSLALSAVALCLPLAAGAVTKVYSFNLTSSEQVPMNPSPAAGSVQLTVDDTADTISFVLTAFNLQGTFTSAHIHGQALSGANAGVVFDLGMNADDFMGPVTLPGPFVIPNSYALLGSDRPTVGSLADMINAMPWMYYVNLHTQAYGMGEIRGQLAPVPEASTYAMFLGGLGLVGFLAARRRKPA